MERRPQGGGGGGRGWRQGRGREARGERERAWYGCFGSCRRGRKRTRAHEDSERALIDARGLGKSLPFSNGRRQLGPRSEIIADQKQKIIGQIMWSNLVKRSGQIWSNHLVRPDLTKLVGSWAGAVPVRQPARPARAAGPSAARPEHPVAQVRGGVRERP